MKLTLKTAASAMAVTVFLGSASGALAKAHDQGVADGDFPAVSTGTVVQDLVEGPGISQVVGKGARGAAASANGGDNRVEPVVGNGANEPD